MTGTRNAPRREKNRRTIAIWQQDHFFKKALLSLSRRVFFLLPSSPPVNSISIYRCKSFVRTREEWGIRRKRKFAFYPFSDSEMSWDAFSGRQRDLRRQSVAADCCGIQERPITAQQAFPTDLPSRQKGICLLYRDHPPDCKKRFSFLPICIQCCI